CEPKSRHIAGILEGAIHRPHESVLRSRLAASRQTGSMPLRNVPSPAEITAWLQGRLAAFAPGAALDKGAIDAFNRFEAEIAALLRDSAIARLLKELNVDLPALAKGGSLARRRELVV